MQTCLLVAIRSDPEANLDSSMPVQCFCLLTQNPRSGPRGSGGVPPETSRDPRNERRLGREDTYVEKAVWSGREWVEETATSSFWKKLNGRSSWAEAVREGMGCGGVKKPELLSSSKGDRVRKGLLEEKAAAGSIILKSALARSAESLDQEGRTVAS
jgi:hypothetical protein